MKYITYLLFLIFLSTFVLAGPNDPVRFGNATATTAWIGGSKGNITALGKVVSISNQFCSSSKCYTLTELNGSSGGLITSVNSTWFSVVLGKLHMQTTYLTNFIQSVATGTFNALDNKYLYNTSDTIYFNETRLNSTTNAIIQNNAVIFNKLDKIDQRYNETTLIMGRAYPGICSVGKFVVNTTTTGVQCLTPSYPAESDPIFVANRTSIWSALQSLRRDNTTQAGQLTTLRNDNTTQSSQLNILRNDNTTQAGQLTILRNDNSTQASQISTVNGRVTTINSTLNGRINAINLSAGTDDWNRTSPYIYPKYDGDKVSIGKTTNSGYALDVLGNVSINYSHIGKSPLSIINNQPNVTVPLMDLYFKRKNKNNDKGCIYFNSWDLTNSSIERIAEICSYQSNSTNTVAQQGNIVLRSIVNGVKSDLMYNYLNGMTFAGNIYTLGGYLITAGSLTNLGISSNGGLTFSMDRDNNDANIRNISFIKNGDVASAQNFLMTLYESGKLTLNQKQSYNGADLVYFNGSMRINSTLYLTGKFSSNLTYSPEASIHLVKDSTLSNEDTYGIKIENLENGVIATVIGVSSTINSGIIQSYDPLSSWTTRTLALQPNGGKLTVANKKDYNGAELFYVNGSARVNGTGKITSTLTLGNGTNGRELVRFDTDRDWMFTSAGTGASTSLNLQSDELGKTFIIESRISGLDTALFKMGTPSYILLTPYNGTTAVGTRQTSFPTNLNFYVNGSARVNGTTYLSQNLYIGNASERDQYIYFYEDGSTTGEYIKWSDSQDRIEISDAAYIVNSLVVGDDFNTPDAGDDLWLGTNTQSLSNMSLKADGSAKIKTLNVTSNIYIGNATERTQYIYFYEDGSATGEAIYWKDTSDWFDFSDQINTLGLRSEDNIFTIGAGDDLWLGTSTQSLSNMSLKADGNGKMRNLNLTGNLKGFVNASWIKNATWLTNSSLVNYFNYSTTPYKQLILKDKDYSFHIGSSGSVDTTTKLGVIGTIRSSTSIIAPDFKSTNKINATNLCFDTSCISAWSSVNSSSSGSDDWNISGAYLIPNIANTQLKINSSNFPVAQMIRTSALTTGVRSTFQAVHSTTGNMIDGFGADISFGIRDSAGTVNEIANFAGQRDGADNSGALGFYTYSTGTRYERIRIKSNGRVGINTTTPRSVLDITGNVSLNSFIISKSGQLSNTNKIVTVNNNMLVKNATATNKMGAVFLYNMSYGMILVNDTSGIRIEIGDISEYR